MVLDTSSIFLIASLAFLAGGTIKGIVGIGLPTAAIAFMTLSLDPRIAIALIMFPMVGSNLWQLIRSGHLKRTARRYGLFATVLFFGVLITAFGTQNASDQLLLAALGIALIIFVAVSWRNMVPPLPDAYDRHAQIGFGVFAGIIGGMTSAWAPPMVMYLAAKRVEKDEFVRATGFLIMIGSLPLIVAYIQLGFLTGPLAMMSAAMLVPTLIGFSLGEMLRARLSPEGFRTIILLTFLVLGLNMIRRAIWYV